MLPRSTKFYDALFAAMGAQPGVEDARGRVAYSHNGGRFMITKRIDGDTSIEDPPGKRPNGAYLAYLRDPDGHKIVAVAR
jgi:catechol 2,3-dioxygenase-like lactoylglutathione lyase family enzyme